MEEFLELLKGGVKSHVQPDYDDIKHEYYDPKLMKCTKDFLQFYEPVGPNLQCYSVLWTGDPTGGNLNLRDFPASIRIFTHIITRVRQVIIILT